MSGFVEVWRCDNHRLGCSPSRVRANELTYWYMVVHCMNPIPTDRKGWLIEIGRALRDASEAIPFGPLAGASFGTAELFHLGPVTALKFRGMRRSRRAVREITEAALASYVVTASEGSGSLTNSRVAFAFTYLTTHFALDLLTEQQVAELMDSSSTTRMP